MISDAAYRQMSAQMIRVAMVRSDLYAEYPRLYRAFDHVETSMTSQIPTMAVAPQWDTNSKKLNGSHDLMWNWKFVESLKYTETIKGILLHEILHIVLKHTTSRVPEYKSALLDSQGRQLIKDEEDQAKAMAWNIATDMAINQLIRPLLEEVKTTAVFPETYSLPENKNAEWYYEKVLKNVQDQMKAGKELRQMLKEMAKKLLDNHGQWAPGQGKQSKKEKKEAEKALTAAKKALAESGAQHEGSDRGDEIDEKAEKIDAELDEIQKETGLGNKAGTSNQTTNKINLKAGKAKKVPGWMQQTKTSSVHGYTITSRLTRKLPNRRFGIVFPGKKRIQVGNRIAVYVDVSGSIDMPLYEQFTAHLHHLQRFADFDLIFFNTQLLTADGRAITPEMAASGTVTRFKKGMTCRISGGTDFEPVMQCINLTRSKYDAHFIFTDGEAGYNTPPTRERNVNWIVYTHNDSYIRHNMRHGKIHIMDRNKEENQ